LLLSSLPLSCIIALIREIVNKNSFLYKSATFYSIEMNTVFKDVKMNRMRGRSSMLSLKSSRESSIYSNLLFQLYADRIEAKDVQQPDRGQ